MLVTLFVEVVELEKFDGQRKERGKGAESELDDKTGFIYRGPSPHKFTPMPGAHNGIQPMFQTPPLMPDIH